ncbi:MAG: shikimate kinase [Brumimicrobium sp.]|nr:shikimate kinase [Brumimicrobium sp.]
MGSGKTKLGKKLAKQLTYSFYDIDAEIESQFQMSISEFFQAYGEDEFRKQETEILNAIVLKDDNAIISVGGGLPCFNNNLQTINKYGVSIYLKRTIKELYNRLRETPGDRPLLKGKKDEELLDFITTTLMDREKFYKQSSYIVERENQNEKDIIKLLNLS